MRLWLTALVFMGVGALLVVVGAARFFEAWPGSVASVDGAVAQVETGALTGDAGRTVFRLEGRVQAFELGTLPLAYPTAGQLADSGRVKVDYEGQPRLRELGPGQHVPVHVAIGLDVDGRVYYSPADYRMAAAFWALVFALPGAIAFSVGAVWVYRLSRNPRWRRRAMHDFAYYGPVLRDPRKTASGEWLH